MKTFSMYPLQSRRQLVSAETHFWSQPRRAGEPPAPWQHVLFISSVFTCKVSRYVLASLLKETKTVGEQILRKVASWGKESCGERWWSSWGWWGATRHSCQSWGKKMLTGLFTTQNTGSCFQRLCWFSTSVGFSPLLLFFVLCLFDVVCLFVCWVRVSHGSPGWSGAH